MASTQQFLPVQDIKEDVVILKDGSVAMVIQTSAVNFDLLSENEQLAIIGSFAAMLNSLSFAIQIVIRSERLDISKYLQTLKVAEGYQTNPLLQTMMQHYRQFVTNIIRENEVLDKQFYVVISVSSLELGVVKNIDKNLQKAITILIPRRDHIMRQLGRIGLKSSQMETEKLIRLFYDLYNEPLVRTSATPPAPQPNVGEQLAENSVNKNPTPPQPTPTVITPTPLPVQDNPPVPAAFASAATTINPLTQTPPPTPVPVAPEPAPAQNNYQSRATNRNPFVVEELPDDYGVA